MQQSDGNQSPILKGCHLGTQWNAARLSCVYSNHAFPYSLPLCHGVLVLQILCQKWFFQSLWHYNQYSGKAKTKKENKINRNKSNPTCIAYPSLNSLPGDTGSWNSISGDNRHELRHLIHRHLQREPQWSNTWT